uniref:Uncharacterized protein n=1 Tax=Caenorhabditis japonica TaxID=281687 RepID=A0A8R1ES88_CAEJA
MCNMVFKMVWGIGIDKMKEKKICSSTKAVKISQGIEWAKIKEDVEMKENVMTEEEKLNEISARVIQEESLCV